MNVPRRIMLIDDDRDDQILFQEAVQVINPDLRCELASSCQQALRQLEELPLPDFIFMDLNMSVINGFDCLVNLKNQNNYKDIPVVILTTSKNLDDVNRTKLLGAKWYMTKPDDFNILCQKLNKILQKDSPEGLYTI